MTTKNINVARDFHRAPAGRYRDYGNFSGERFRDEFLLPYIRNDQITTLRIDLNNLDGVGSSFWEEAFGGLIRNYGIPLHKIKEKIQLICEDDITLIPTINSFLYDAERARK